MCLRSGFKLLSLLGICLSFGARAQSPAPFSLPQQACYSYPGEPQPPRPSKGIIIFANAKNCKNCFPELSQKIGKAYPVYLYELYGIEDRIRDTALLAQQRYKSWKKIFPQLSGIILEFADADNLFQYHYCPESNFKRYGVEISPSVLLIDGAREQFFDYDQSNQLQAKSIKKWFAQASSRVPKRHSKGSTSKRG